MEEGCRTNLEEHHEGSVPGWENDGFMRTVSSPQERGLEVFLVTCSTIPWGIRKPMNPTDLEEGLAVFLVLVIHGLCKG